MSCAAYEGVGYYGTGAFSQSGGSNYAASGIVVGWYQGSSGTYNLTSGSICSGTQYAGDIGTGVFNQSGGTNNNTGNLYIDAFGGSGNYSLSGSGMLSIAGAVFVGNATPGSAVFSQSGGLNQVTNTLYLGYGRNASGTYSLSGGQLSTTGSLVVGNSGNGLFTQSGGVNDVGTFLILGNNANAGSTASYSLNGGTLSAFGECVANCQGNSGTVLSQTGGCNFVTFYFGVGTAGAGSYTLSGTGQLIATTSEIIGDWYTGTSGVFTQAGGTNTITGSNLSLILGNHPGATGTYNLNGGLLVVPQILANAGVFNFGGGTLQGSPSLSTTVAMTLTNGGLATVYTTSGNVVTLSGLLSGGGTLMALGGGTLALNNTSNSYSGGTILGGGELSVSARSQLGYGPLTFSGGTLQVVGTAMTNLNGTTVNWLTFNGGFDIAVGNGFIVSSTIGGAGSLCKLGPGSLTLAATNASTYTGTTTVGAGILSASGNLSGTSGINVLGGRFIAPGYNPAAPLSVGAGAQADVTGTGLSIAGPITNAGGVAFDGSSGTVILASLSGAGSTFFWAAHHQLAAQRRHGVLLRTKRVGSHNWQRKRRSRQHEHLFDHLRRYADRQRHQRKRQRSDQHERHGPPHRQRDLHGDYDRFPRHTAAWRRRSARQPIFQQQPSRRQRGGPGAELLGELRQHARRRGSAPEDGRRHIDVDRQSRRVQRARERLPGRGSCCRHRRLRPPTRPVAAAHSSSRAQHFRPAPSRFAPSTTRA